MKQFLWTTAFFAVFLYVPMFLWGVPAVIAWYDESARQFFGIEARLLLWWTAFVFWVAFPLMLLAVAAMNKNKIALFLLAVALTVVVASAALAQPHRVIVPGQYVGMWCDAGSGRAFRKCREADSESYLSMLAATRAASASAR